MNWNWLSAARVGVMALALIGLIVVGSIVIAAEAPKEAKPAAGAAAQTEFTLPPGWTKADMEACVLAGTPGKMQAFLAKGAGVWHGKSTMWMGPGGEPV